MNWRLGNAAKSVSMIAIGAGTGQFIYLLSSPAIARLFSPEDFGTYAIYAAILGVAGILATARFELAIPLASSARNSAAVIATAFLSLILSALVLALLVAVIPDRFLDLAWLRESGSLLFLLPLGVLAIGSLQIALFTAIRAEKFASVAHARFWNGASLAATHVGAGYAGLGALGLVLGQIASHLVAASMVAGRCVALLRQYWPTAARLAKTARKYKNFPKYSAPAAALNAMTVRAPAALFAVLYGSNAGGQFLFCQTVLAAPVLLFGRAVGQVFLSKIASKKRSNDRNTRAFLLKTSSLLARIAVLPALAVLVFGPAVIGFWFGGQWDLAGDIARILAVVVFFEFVVVPIGQTLEMLEKQSIQFAWDLMRLIAVVLSISATSIAGYSILTAVSIYAAVLVLSYVVYFAWVLHACGEFDRSGSA